jgi:hypothetical protein
MEPQQVAPPGVIVYGADGEPLGTITSSEETYVVVDSGADPPTFYVPVGAIVDWREDGLYLSMTSADARRQGWDEAPAGELIPESNERFQQVTGYTAVQAEDSLEDDPMPTPSDENSGEADEPVTPPTEDLDRPSGEPGAKPLG